MLTRQDQLSLQQSESIENTALTALHSAADAPLSEHLGLSLVSISDSLVSSAAALPTSAITVNRAVGLGRRYPVRADSIRAITDHYRQAGVHRYFLQPYPDIPDDDIAPLCIAAGLERARAWQKFARGRDEPLPDITPGLPIREVGREHGDAFAEIVCAAFDLGGKAIPWLARLPNAPGWRIFMGFDGNTPASAGAVFISGEEAFTDFGATAVAYRRRGLQLANLACRVRAALDLGCQRIHTCTGIAVPGDPQHSYGNILKCGFSETHVRAAWVPASAPA